MNKKTITLISIAILVLIAGVVFGLGWKEKEKKQEKDQTINEVLKKAEEEKTFVIEKAPENQEEENQEKPKDFVLPDMNQENWETYTDDAWGFSIKFPKEFYYRVHPQGAKSPEEGEGGQLLIISDQREMGIQDVMLYESVHIIIQSNKWSKANNLKNFINDKHFNSDDGNKLIEIKIKEYSSKDYLVKTYIEYKKYPYDGVFYNKHLNLYNFSRYLIKNDWRYSIYGGLPSLTNKKVSNKQEIISLIESIISTFKFIE